MRKTIEYIKGTCQENINAHTYVTHICTRAYTYIHKWCTNTHTNTQQNHECAYLHQK